MGKSEEEKAAEATKLLQRPFYDEGVLVDVYKDIEKTIKGGEVHNVDSELLSKAVRETINILDTLPNTAGYILSFEAIMNDLLTHICEDRAVLLARLNHTQDVKQPAMIQKIAYLTIQDIMDDNS